MPPARVVRRVRQPVTGPRAFRREDDAAVLSQAAFLLQLGSQLRGDAAAFRGRAAAASGRRREAVPRRDRAAFPVPVVRDPGRRVEPPQVQARLARRYGRALTPAPGHPGSPPPEVLGDLAARLQQRPTALATAELMEACLAHPRDVPRIAAAWAYFPLSAEPARLLDVLVAGTASDDPLARTMAATALARVAPEHPRLAELTRPAPPGPGGAPAHTSLLVHGTFAHGTAWWQPGGDFHEYLRAEVRPDLYGAPDRFDWSGGYSDAARALGAADLDAWVAGHGAGGLDLLTHSHGGSVAMLASQNGLAVGVLVLLSCPAHPSRYLPHPARVKRTVSVRVHLDLVILIDGGGQRFQEPEIEEHVLPLWFDHFATHDPDVWREHGVPALL
jgi:hypothetical protein